MQFVKALNEYGRRYNDIKDLARSGAINVEIMNSAIMTDEGEKIKVIFDEKNSAKNRYQLTFAKKTDKGWERDGQPVASDDFEKLMKKAIDVAEKKKIKPAKFKTKFKAFLADYVGKPTRNLFK